MRKESIWRKVLAWGISIAIVSVWMPDISLAQENLITEDHVTQQAVVDVTENTTTYQLTDGAKMTVFHGEDVRFEDQYGNLVDYDPSLIETEDQVSANGNLLDGYAYENLRGDSKQYLPESLSGDAPVLMEKDGHEIQLSMTDETLTDTGLMGEKICVEEETIQTPYESEEKADVNALYGSEESDVRLSYTSEKTGIKERVILNAVPESNVFTYTLKLKGLKRKVQELL